MPVRIYTDFNSRTIEGELLLKLPSQELDVNPYSGMDVTFYDEGLEVDGIIEYSSECKRWLGKPNWDTCRDIPWTP
jgi:hypothetical protein